MSEWVKVKNSMTVSVRIKIKSWKEIKKTLSPKWKSKDNVFFDRKMKRFCEKTLLVEELSFGYVVAKGWYWKPEWYIISEDWCWSHESRTSDEAIATITIDLTDPKSARAAVEDAIRNYENRPREWTNDEIAKAGKMADEMILELHHNRLSPVFYYVPKDKRTELEFRFGFPCKHGSYTARAHGNDAYNEVIGRCVCLCKATGRDIPDFIRR